MRGAHSTDVCLKASCMTLAATHSEASPEARLDFWRDAFATIVRDALMKEPRCTASWLTLASVLDAFNHLPCKPDAVAAEVPYAELEYIRRCIVRSLCLRDRPVHAACGALKKAAASAGESFFPPPFAAPSCVTLRLCKEVGLDAEALPKVESFLEWHMCSPVMLVFGGPVEGVLRWRVSQPHEGSPREEGFPGKQDGPCLAGAAKDQEP